MSSPTPAHASREPVFIHSRGVRIHADIQGPRNAPLILLIHGFGGGSFEFAELMDELAHHEQPVRVAAVDLRGYGASDKTPRGYDLTTAASDMAGVIRRLGHSSAVVVGHGYGGLVGWTLAAHEPERVRRLITLGSAHPVEQYLRAAINPLGHWSRVQRVLSAQIPRLPESRLTKNDAALAEKVFRQCVAPGFRDTAPYRRHARLRRDAIQQDKVAHLACEYQRWLFRARLRPEGFAFSRTFPQRVACPVTAVDGSMDPGFDADLVNRGVQRARAEGSEAVLLYGVGHYPHIEDPVATAEIIAAG